MEGGGEEKGGAGRRREGGEVRWRGGFNKTTNGLRKCQRVDKP